MLVSNIFIKKKTKKKGMDLIITREINLFTFRNSLPGKNESYCIVLLRALEMFCCVNELCPGTGRHISLFLCSLELAVLQSESHLLGCFYFDFHGFLSIHPMPG